MSVVTNAGPTSCESSVGRGLLPGRLLTKRPSPSAVAWFENVLRAFNPPDRASDRSRTTTWEEGEETTIRRLESGVKSSFEAAADDESVDESCKAFNRIDDAFLIRVGRASFVPTYSKALVTCLTMRSIYDLPDPPS